MGENTKIEWCTHSVSPWRGCAKISAGCTNCYAEKMSHRNPKVLGMWGEGKDRPLLAENGWKQIHKWNRDAEKAGEIHRIFVNSISDFFEDRPDLDAQRVRLLETAKCCPSLVFMLLTKRAHLIASTLSRCGVETLPSNVWIGVSVENQQAADERIPHLTRVPAALRFLSVEPLLGPVTLDLDGISWAIVGGESGPKARVCDIEWVEAVVSQCKASGVPVFVKQLGARVRCSPYDFGHIVRELEAANHNADDVHFAFKDGVQLDDKKGGDMNEWPAHLRVREIPTVRR